MVDHFGIPWTHFCAGDPSVMRKIALHENKLIIQYACRGYLKLLRHLNNEIRLNVPAFLKLDRGGLVLGIAFRGSAVYPKSYRLNLRLCQSRTVDKMIVLKACQTG